MFFLKFLKQKAKKAFDALTVGKQREYAEHIASAKQDKTRASRLAKIIPMIEARPISPMSARSLTW